jgi:hypothetical protein
VTILEAVRAEERKLAKQPSKLQGARVFPTFRFDNGIDGGAFILSFRNDTTPRSVN